MQGEAITIVNAEKVVVTGSRGAVFAKFKVRQELRAKGNPRKGPKLSKTPDRLVRRTIRNMMPTQRTRGREAIRKLTVYIGVPESMKEHQAIAMENSRARAGSKHVTVAELSQWLGAQWK